MLRAIIIIFSIFFIIAVTTFGWQGFHLMPEFYVQDEALPGRLKKHVVKLSHEIGDRSVFRHSALTQAAAYIAEEFDKMGLTVEFQKYELHGKETKNVIARKPGAKNPDEIIVIGAHYDTCFNPGANDNASGVAGLIELARLLSDLENKRTIKFIAFVNEEPPFFKTENMGSYVYAKSAREENKDIKAAIILETIGFYSSRPFSQRYPLLLGPFFPNRANFIAFVGNSTNKEIVNKVKGSFSEHSDFPAAAIVLFDFVPGVDFSDHWSFWQFGFPAAMVTDTAFYRYEHYHQSTDTYEKLDYRAMAAVIEGIKKVLICLAE